MRIVKIGEVRENPISTSPVTSPEDCLKYLGTIRDQLQEHFVALTLDGAGNIITSRVITVGLLNHTLVHPRVAVAMKEHIEKTALDELDYYIEAY